MLRLNIFFLFLVILDQAFGYDYIIIGAGAAGIQMGIFMKESNVSYVIYEKSDTAGSFWTKYPVTSELISINGVDKSMRYDFHSLLNAPRFNSSNYFPLNKEYHSYLNTISVELNIIYNTSIVNVIGGPCVVLFTGEKKCAKKVFIATGLTPKLFPDMESFGVIPYSDFKISMVKNEKICILGNGNSAWEIAQASVPFAKSIILISRRETRWSMITKYTGDVRIKYAQPLENFHSKQLSLTNWGVFVGKRNFRDKLKEFISSKHAKYKIYNNQTYCTKYFLAWGFQSNIPGTTLNSTFPDDVNNWYESNISNVHYIGWHMHEHDFMKGSGGFNVGFRYLIRNLWNHIHEVESELLSWKHVIDKAYDRIGKAVDILIMQDGEILRDVIIQEDFKWKYMEGYNYNFLPKEQKNKAITIYFAWGNVRDTRTVLEEQLYMDNTSLWLRNAMLHPVIEFMGKSYHLLEQPINQWFNNFYRMQVDICFQDINAFIMRGTMLPSYWVNMPKWKWEIKQEHRKEKKYIRDIFEIYRPHPWKWMGIEN
jgi:hypothetical protein